MKVPVQSQPIVRSEPSGLIVEIYDLTGNDSQIRASYIGTCAPFYITGNTGRGLWKNAAKFWARVKWRQAVRSTPLLGDDYTNWSLAQDNGYNCNKKWGLWRCTAYGIPCTYY